MNSNPWNFILNRSGKCHWLNAYDEQIIFKIIDEDIDELKSTRGTFEELEDYLNVYDEFPNEFFFRYFLEKNPKNQSLNKYLKNIQAKIVEQYQINQIVIQIINFGIVYERQDPLIEELHQWLREEVCTDESYSHLQNCDHLLNIHFKILEWNRELEPQFTEDLEKLELDKKKLKLDTSELDKSELDKSELELKERNRENKITLLNLEEIPEDTTYLEEFILEVPFLSEKGLSPKGEEVPFLSEKGLSPKGEVPELNQLTQTQTINSETHSPRITIYTLSEFNFYLQLLEKIKAQTSLVLNLTPHLKSTEFRGTLSTFILQLKNIFKSYYDLTDQLFRKQTTDLESILPIPKLEQALDQLTPDIFNIKLDQILTRAKEGELLDLEGNQGLGYFWICHDPTNQELAVLPTLGTFGNFLPEPGFNWVKKFGPEYFQDSEITGFQISHLRKFYLKSEGEFQPVSLQQYVYFNLSSETEFGTVMDEVLIDGVYLTGFLYEDLEQTEEFKELEKLEQEKFEQEELESFKEFESLIEQRRALSSNQ